MDYYEVSISSGYAEAYDILTAELSELGFDSFTEEDGSLKAYAPASDYNETAVNELLQRYADSFELKHEAKLIPHTNWNAIWESSFEPVVINKELLIRAPYHEPNPNYPLEIIVQPKMSFGTGHHPTTSLVMGMMLDMDFEDKSVMDFGTGTGILAVLAEKLGAKEIYAVDNDSQCIENASENIVVNNSTNIVLSEGDINAIGVNKYDIVIGNITRNTILGFLEEIAQRLRKGGFFIASGFYKAELPIIKDKGETFELQLISSQEKDNWCAALFEKV